MGVVLDVVSGGITQYETITSRKTTEISTPSPFIEERKKEEEERRRKKKEERRKKERKKVRRID